MEQICHLNPNTYLLGFQNRLVTCQGYAINITTCGSYSAYFVHRPIAILVGVRPFLEMTTREASIGDILVRVQISGRTRKRRGSGLAGI